VGRFGEGEFGNRGRGNLESFALIFIGGRWPPFGVYSSFFSSVGVSGFAKSDSNFFVPSFRTLVLIWTVAWEISFPRTVFLNLSPFGFLLNFFSPFGFLCMPWPYPNNAFFRFGPSIIFTPVNPALSDVPVISIS